MPLLRQILVPTDFSQNSGHAISYACDLAKQASSRLHLVHVLQDASGNRTAAVDRLAGIGMTAGGRVGAVTETHVITGTPAAAITEYAQQHEIDLVVMSTHGRTGLSHLTMGSVAEHVLRKAQCPVLVIGPRDSENVSIARAAAALTEFIGEGLVGEIETGRGQMLNKLIEQLRIPATTAILMLDELEERDWLRYERPAISSASESNFRGSWVAVKGTDLAENSEPFVPNFYSESPAIELLQRAKKMRATDIHIDPFDKEEYRVRFRIDGGLREYCRLQNSLAVQTINRFKTLGGVDTADPFHSQESRLRLPEQFADWDVRLTAIPVAGGQAVALRLLDANAIALPLDYLGFSDRALSTIEEILKIGEGLVLVSGPTGSGKTTTVYSMLQSLDGSRLNIVSIEDPVEFAVSFVRQMNVDLKHGVTMAAGLRTILRTDPDVVFVGEVRDIEAAQIGMRAASSGKYVFSTMHTRDVAGTLTALRDLQIDNHSLATNVSGIINQRLVRRLCQVCRSPQAVAPTERERFNQVGIEVPEVLCRPVGCAACNGTGFFSRIGIFEVAALFPELRAAILNGDSAAAIQSLLRNSGVVSLERDALSKAAAGVISFDEAVGIRWLI